MVWNVQTSVPVRASKARTSPGRVVLVHQAIADAVAQDHQVAVDERRRGVRVVLAVDWPQQVFGQIDLAVLAEARHRQAGLGIERNQAMAGVEEDAQGALVAPRRHAAMDEPLAAGRLTVVVGLRVEGPDLASGGRLEGNHAVVGRAHVEHAVDHERGVLERTGKRAQLLVRLLAGLPLPGHAQPRDVIAVDLRQRRVLPAAWIAAVDRPVAGRLLRSDPGRVRRHEQRHDRGGSPGPHRCLSPSGRPPGSGAGGVRRGSGAAARRPPPMPRTSRARQSAPGGRHERRCG